MKYFFSLLGMLILSSSFNSSRDSSDLRVITRIKQEGFDNSKVMSILFQLTDVIGPRLSGSSGMKQAEEWTRKQLEDWGLQNAHIEAWGGFGKGWEIQHCYAAMSVPYYQPLIGVPKAWTPGTNGPIKADAIFVKIEGDQDMAKYAGRLTGKIAVMSSGEEAKPNFIADAKRLTAEELNNLQKDPHVTPNVDQSKEINRKRMPGMSR